MDDFSLLNSYILVSHETYSNFVIYRDLLFKWQKSVNLVSNNTIPDFWVRHILDSLQLISHIPTDSIIMDIGTGAGFPGLVLAMAGYNNITLVDADTKKIMFLREIARVTKTKVFIVRERLENISFKNIEYIVSRGFSTLANILDICNSNNCTNIVFLLHKGRNWYKEVEQATIIWQFDYEAIPSIVTEDGIILKISSVSKRSRYEK